jgi:drug/metabolite transporter (DMT)-like permease
VLNYAFSDYLWAHAVLLLGPTIATLGLSVQIPIAAAAEAAFGHAAWLRSWHTAAMTLGGTGLILLGFFWGNLAGGKEDKVPGGHHRGEGAAAEAAAGAAAAHRAGMS